MKYLLSLVFLAVTAFASAFHWTADHVDVTYVYSGSGNTYGAAAHGGGGYTLSYSAFCAAEAFYSGPTTRTGNYIMTMTAKFYVNYVKDSPSDTDAPDTATGTGKFWESLSSAVGDLDSFAYPNGGLSVAKGEGNGLANFGTYNWGGPGNVGYSSSVTTGETFAFVNNTGTESGTHYALLDLLGPKGDTEADAAVSELGATPTALAQLSVFGTLTIDYVNGLPVH